MHKLTQNNPYQPMVNGKPKAPNGTNFALYHGLSGATSDHTPRVFKTAYQRGEQSFSIKGGVWNLMVYAQEGCTSPYSPMVFANNPLLETEDDLEYLSRKIYQIEYILMMLGSQQLDYLFLQETDFLGRVRNESPWLTHEKSALAEYFMHALEIMGYGISMKPGSLATLYKKTVFQDTELHDHGFSLRGLKLFCRHLPTGKMVALINVHLLYRADYAQGQIIDRVLKGTDPEIFTLMGGDANHPAGPNLPQLITAPQPSNVTAEMTPDLRAYNRAPNNAPILTTKDEEGRDKAYDGIFLYAPPDWAISVSLDAGFYIGVKGNKARFIPYVETKSLDLHRSPEGVCRSGKGPPPLVVPSTAEEVGSSSSSSSSKTLLVRAQSKPASPPKPLSQSSADQILKVRDVLQAKYEGVSYLSLTKEKNAIKVNFNNKEKAQGFAIQFGGAEIERDYEVIVGFMRAQVYFPRCLGLSVDDFTGVVQALKECKGNYTRSFK